VTAMSLKWCSAVMYHFLNSSQSTDLKGQLPPWSDCNLSKPLELEHPTSCTHCWICTLFTVSPKYAVGRVDSRVSFHFVKRSDPCLIHLIDPCGDFFVSAFTLLFGTPILVSLMVPQAPNPRSWRYWKGTGLV